MSVVYRYYISVESEGGADLSFGYVSDHELAPNEVVRDDLDRSFAVLSVSNETVLDPVDDDVVLGSATARPA